MTGRTRVKICGITRPEDALAAAHLGVDALGFVFVPASKRYIDIADAAAIIRRLPAFVVPVGLFLDADASTVATALQAIPSLVPQFHGRETAEECESFGRPYLKALALGGSGDSSDPNGDLQRNVREAAQAYSFASAFLLDSHAAGGLGGTGIALDWNTLVGAEQWLDGRPMILAGGLAPDTVGRAIDTTHPWAVDVSSGVESAKGIKDHEAMAAFMAAVAEVDKQV